MVEESDEVKRLAKINIEDSQKIRLPADPNLLKFYEQEVSISYMKHIYFSKSGKTLSDEFYGKLLIFYLNLFLMCLCYMIFSIIAFYSNKMSKDHMAFHVVWNISLIILSLGALPLLKNPEVFIKIIKLFFSGLSLLVYTYFVIGNPHVLNSINGTESSEYSLPLNIGIVAYSITLKYVLYNNFFCILVLSIFMLFEYIAATLSSSNAYNLENINDFFIIFIFIVLQVIDTQHSEYKLKNDFWQDHRNENSYRTSLTIYNEDTEGGFHTETEILIQACNKIIKTLKYACTVIIFKDIKDSLKLAQAELEHVKHQIARAGYLKEVKIEPRPDMDPEDKEFISQNCLDISYATPAEKSVLSDAKLFEIKDRLENFPFSHYGIDKLESVLSQLGRNWSFDIWFVYNSTGHSVSIIGKYLFEKWQINGFLNVGAECVDNFFMKLEKGYNKNPYHNACHAADVLHTQMFFILQSDIIKSLTEIDIVASIISALGHDVGHPALTNRFLVNNRDKIAIRYNDASVLESMHTAKTFKLLSIQDSNIFKNLSTEDWIRTRKIIIEMILETDMSRHFEILGKFRTRAQTLSNFDISIFEDKCQILGMSLKCADIGHSAKDYDLHEKWSILVCEEFFHQGDLEKARGQSVSMYCDRDTTDIPKSQAGFIKNICLPLYEIWALYLKSETIERFVLFQLQKNLEFWNLKKKRRATVKTNKLQVKSEFLKRIQSSK
ncbi:hypothetical protein SteCoe_5224 [Stentor coeruleus]|uniref:Phosphodiesterase n=1 Tax=Stentor coeruleus TaxID=5963 RepID=A0A1R2CT15_9CILI|nr:hypothetical protein SteCoe_5224 [Stentor coeruleus]